MAAVTADPAQLDPPNHKMADVTIGYLATDVSGAPVCSLSVASNEAVNGTGDGNTGTDWLVIDAHHVQLRAERAGGGSGRIYTITIGCADAWGNHSSATATVRVPH